MNLITALASSGTLDLGLLLYESHYTICTNWVGKLLLYESHYSTSIQWYTGRSRGGLYLKPQKI